MEESAEAAGDRLALGKQLVEARRGTGWAQWQLADRMGYSRTAVSTAERGKDGVGPDFWARVDSTLGTGEMFARGFDRIQARKTAEESRAAQRPAPVAAGPDWDEKGTLIRDEALPVYRQRGWLTEEDADGQLWLVTGRVVDALELPRPAGLVALNWWLWTRGVPDEIRGLPSLPDPAHALAMILAGPRCYFLTPSGASPWLASGHAALGAGSPADEYVVRWHAGGSRIPCAVPKLVHGR